MKKYIVTLVTWNPEQDGEPGCQTMLVEARDRFSAEKKMCKQILKEANEDELDEGVVYTDMDDYSPCYEIHTEELDKMATIK